LAIWVEALTEKNMIKLGIVMDPIATINIKKDTSFAMLLEAQRRGYELHYMEMNDLYLINGEARAHAHVNVEQNYDKWYEFGTEQDLRWPISTSF
jgi:glutathione synthase